MTYLLDANVLLRFITKTPLAMAERARNLLQKGENGEVILIVHTVIVAEVFYVLRSVYKYDAERVAKELELVLESDAVQVNKEAIQALKIAAQYNLDYADALLIGLARASGNTVVSFDKDFKKVKVGENWLEP